MDAFGVKYLNLKPISTSGVWPTCKLLELTASELNIPGKKTIIKINVDQWLITSVLNIFQEKIIITI